MQSIMNYIKHNDLEFVSNTKLLFIDQLFIVFSNLRSSIMFSNLTNLQVRTHRESLASLSLEIHESWIPFLDINSQKFNRELSTQWDSFRASLVEQDQLWQSKVKMVTQVGLNRTMEGIRCKELTSIVIKNLHLFVTNQLIWVKVYEIQF